MRLALPCPELTSVAHCKRFNEIEQARRTFFCGDLGMCPAHIRPYPARVNRIHDDAISVKLLRERLHHLVHRGLSSPWCK